MKHKVCKEMEVEFLDIFFEKKCPGVKGQASQNKVFFLLRHLFISNWLCGRGRNSYVFQKEKHYLFTTGQDGERVAFLDLP